MSSDFYGFIPINISQRIERVAIKKLIYNKYIMFLCSNEYIISFLLHLSSSNDYLSSPSTYIGISP